MHCPVVDANFVDQAGEEGAWLKVIIVVILDVAPFAAALAPPRRPGMFSPLFCFDKMCIIALWL